MKQKLLLFATILFALCTPVHTIAQTFSAISPSGHTLYYRVTDPVNNYVMLTCPNDNLTYSDFDVWSQPCSALWGNNAFPTGSVVLPETVTNGGTTYTVKAIGGFTFFKCPITSIVMSNTIDSIGNFAFFQCSYMSNVTFSNTLRVIGEEAFRDCFLGNVVLPSSVRVLKVAAFSNAHIPNITLNDSLEVMEVHCLSGNLFDSLYIPASVREIQSPCWYMSSLSKIVVDPSNPYYDSRNNCNAIINTMGEVVQACFGTVLPEGINRLWGDAFRGYNYETLEVPSSVLYMGFVDCHIGTLVLSSPQFTLDFWGNSFDTIKVMTDTPPLFMSSLIGDFNDYVRYQTPIVVTCNALPAFQTANVWSNFTNYIGVFPYSATAQDNEHGYVQVEQPSCANQTATYTAYPTAGYHFVQWNDGEYNNPRVVGVTCDTSLSAIFALTDTMHVTLAEGEQHHGRTQAGVWLDTIAGYLPDSVVLSIIDITVNRPMNNSTVMLGSNIAGVWNLGDDVVWSSEVALQVPPTESRQIVFSAGEIGSNLISNGNFEQGNIGSFITDYATPDSPGSAYRTYSYQGGNGVDGSNCIYFDGSEIADQAVIAVSKPTVTGCWYRFSYMVRNTGGGNPPYFQVKVNGVPLQGTDIVPQDGGIWTTFTHDFLATSPLSSIEIVDLCQRGDGNDFYLDNISLVQITSNFSYTINVTNTHGLVLDTVNVAIAEGEGYRGHTLAGVYQDTIIGSTTDSIVHSRVSMTVNRPMNNCVVQLGGNMGGTYFNGDEFYAAGNSEVQVLPVKNEILHYSSGYLGSNILAVSDMEDDNSISNYHNLYAADHVSTLEYYELYVRDDGVDGSHCLTLRGKYDNNQVFFRTRLTSNVGDRYQFHFMAYNNTPAFVQPILLKINGNIIYPADSIKTYWSSFDYTIEATSDTLLIELVNATPAHDDLVEWSIDNMSLTKVYSVSSDSITIINTHGLLHDTMNVTINEGGNYRGHTLAGVYQDTIIGSTTDSIVHSRVSMIVNRPMDNCMVQLGRNIDGYYFGDLNHIGRPLDDISLQVLPGQNKQVLFSAVITANDNIGTPSSTNMFVGNGSNLIPNGDFEQGNTGFTTNYTYTNDCNYAGCGNETYSIQQGFGVDGSYGMGVDGAVVDKLLYEVTIPNAPGLICKFSYMARTENHPSPYFAVLVNGVQIDSIDYVSNNNDWVTFEHIFTAGSSNIVLQLYNRNLEGGGNDFFMDNFRLEGMLMEGVAVDTITITNTHGLVRDTVDVTITEGENYRGHTLAGVYQDTIIGAATDSIVRSRVSMTVDRPMDNYLVQLGGNLGGTYFNGENLYAAGSAAIQVPPADSKTLMFSPEPLGVNLLTFGDEDYSNYNQYCGDFCSSAGHYDGRGYNGSNALYVGFGCQENLAFFRIALDSKSGEQYKFSYLANSCNMNRQILAVKVNGVQLPQVDSLTYYVEGTENQWGSFEHLITATGDTTVIEMVNLQADAGDWFMDNFRLMKVYSTITDSITITNTHGLVYDTVDVTIAEGESYHGHTLAGVYMDTIIGVATDSIVYARVSMDINYSFGAGNATLATNFDDRMWIGQNDDVLSTEPTITVQVPPANEFNYVLTMPADGSNLQPNSDFEQGQNNWSSEYAWSDTPFQGSHYITICDNCGHTDRGMAVKGSMMATKAFYQGEWLPLEMGHRYSFSYWAKSHSVDNPAILAIKVNDQQREWLLPETDTIASAEWTRYEHIFTAQRTNNTLMRIFDFNTSPTGNEFYLDDVSLIDLTEAADAHRDTVRIRNTHGLHYATVDATINEGENYNGFTLAGVYNDTVQMTEYDSITRYRLSYVLNTTGMGVTTLDANTEGLWMDIDAGGLLGNDSISVTPMQTRTLGFASLMDNNLVTNGDFSVLDTLSFNHHRMMYLPEPYNLWDWDILGDRGAYRYTNGYLEMLWSSNQGTILSTTLDVQPNTFYQVSFKFRTSSYYSLEEVYADNEKIGYDHNNQYDSQDGNITFDQVPARTYYFNSGNRTQVTVSIRENPTGCCTYMLMDDFAVRPLNLVDTITVTNRHQIVQNTVDVTINEGESYNGHTLAGIYNDTLYFTDFDSIIHSRVCMTVNRPLDNCLVSVGSNTYGAFYADETIVGGEGIIQIEVPPASSVQLIGNGDNRTYNLIQNGDFESGDQGFITEYNDCNCQSAQGGPTNYDVYQGCGVDGGYGMGVDGAETDMLIWQQSVALVPGTRYQFSYMAKNTCQGNSPLLELLANGMPIGSIDTIPLSCDDWVTFTHNFLAVTSSVVFQLYDRYYEYSGNDFFLDNFRLIPISFYDSTLIDTITITNIHGLVRDTVDVTIAEGQSYRDYAIAGIYQDTVIGAQTDSIVYSRVSMNINHTYGAGTTSLTTNLEGRIWMGLDDATVTTEQGLTVDLQPTEERRYVLTTAADYSNLQPNGGFEQGQYVNWSTDYAWSDNPFQGSSYFTVCDSCGRTGKGVAVKGSELNGFVYNGEWLNLTEGHRYSFSYWAKSRTATSPAVLTVYVNDQQSIRQLPETDDLDEAVGEWKRYEHIFTANSFNPVLMRIADLNTSATGNEFYLDDVSLIDLTEDSAAHRDTITVRNIHDVHYSTVDVTINEGESYNGHTTAGIYNDTIVLTDYDSIVLARVSYILNTSGEGLTTLASNTDGFWMDIDEDELLTSNSVGVYPSQTRRFGRLVQASDTNLISNGDFELGNVGFTSHFLWRPEPYSLGDGTYYIGGYRINEMGGNHYLYAFNYWAPEQGALYETTVNVEPNTWYLFSYRGVSNALRGDVTDNLYGNDNTVTVNGLLIGNDSLAYSGNVDITQAKKFVYYIYNNSNTTMSISLNSNYGECYNFAYDDITLTPLVISDTITVTNRHLLVYDTVRADICQGNTFTYNSSEYSASGLYAQPVQYYVDSTVYRALSLNVHNNYYPQQSASICDGDTYLFGGNTLMQTGVYYDSLMSVWGCDSTVTLTLTVNSPVHQSYTQTACDSYTWNSTDYTATGNYTYNHTDANGCMQVDTLHLTVNYSTTGDTAATVCDQFGWFGQNYTASGTPTHVLTNAAGCDSTVTLTLTVNHSTTGSETDVVCDSIVWHDMVYTASGNYSDVMTNAAGCDSTVTLHLTVNSSYQHSDAVFACDNQLPYDYSGTSLTAAGDYSVVFQSVEGCDSTIAVTLTVGATYQHNDQMTLCQSGMPYTYGNVTFTEDDTTGTYSIPFITTDGCDSIVNLALTVNESENTEIYVVTVQGYNNLVLWNKNAAVDHYNIYRESATAGSYELVAEVPYSEDSEWLDSSSDARTHSYRYKMTSVDSCGTESEPGTTHKTMHLTINRGQGTSWNLVWTEYEGTLYSTYLIYRGTSYDNLQVIDQIPAGGNTTFTDNNAPGGYVYYQIVILLNAKDNSEGIIKSNVATNNQEGIDDIADLPLRIYQQNGNIAVETQPGQKVRVFDVVGRQLGETVSTGKDIFEAPASGVYFVQVANTRARRIVVVK